MRVKRLFPTFLLSFAAAMGPQANAAHIIDQSSLPSDGTQSLITAAPAYDQLHGFRRVQTFTAGITGLLDEIDIMTESNNFAGFNLVSTLGGVPTATVLATGSYLGATSDGWQSFSFDFDQIAGQIYGLEPISGFQTDTRRVVEEWEQDRTGTYAGGADYVVNPGSGLPDFFDTKSDNVFRTFVATVETPPAVPEPATWAMMLGGFGAIGGAMRSRRSVGPFHT